MHDLTIGGLPPPAHSDYLLSFDFDDTLFTPGGDPGERRVFFRLMRRLRTDCGVLWGINTGRDTVYLRKGLEDMFHHVPEAFAPDFTVTMERHVHLACAGETLKPLERWNAACASAHDLLFMRHGQMLNDLLARLERMFKGLGLVRQENDAFSLMVNDPAGLDAVCGVIDGVIAPYDEIVTQRAGPYLRFSHRDCNKGTALARVARQFGIPQECTAIFGDGHNDLDAMRCMPAAFRCCPSNAVEEVKNMVTKGRGYISMEPRTRGVLDGLKNAVLPHFGMADAVADER